MPGFRGCQIHLADPEFRINHSRSTGEWNGVEDKLEKNELLSWFNVEIKGFSEKGVDIMILLEILAFFESLEKIINDKYNKFNNKYNK